MLISLCMRGVDRGVNRGCPSPLQESADSSELKFVWLVGPSQSFTSCS